MKKLTEEAIKLFDSGDIRSFNEIYRGKEYLFEGEDVDNIISPKMKALFESVYGKCNGTKLKEEVAAVDNPNHNFSGEEGKPSGDGVPDNHNPAGIGGQSSAVTQSGHDYSGNPKFFESMKDVYEKAKLKEDFDSLDDLDDLDDEFEVDASDEGEIELLDMDNLDNLDSYDDYFEDFDDGSSLEGSYENMDYSDDEFDLDS